MVLKHLWVCSAYTAGLGIRLQQVTVKATSCIACGASAREIGLQNAIRQQQMRLSTADCHCIHVIIFVGTARSVLVVGVQFV